MPSIVEQFMEELERGTFAPESAREIAEQLKNKMTDEERGRALALITRIEVEGMTRKRTKRTLLEVVPDGWLRQYLEFTQVSESPNSFHLFSALSVLSHLLGRRVWFPLGTRSLFPALSVFLVSPAGQARRSTAIRLACDIGRGAGAFVVQDMATPEGLVTTLEAQPQVLVCADEAATLLTKREYMADMPALLCTLLDCPDAYQRTLKGRTVEVMLPTVNALIGCAPEWITSALPKTALGGGLLSRMLVVYEQTRKMLIALPEDLVGADVLQEMKVHLTRMLRELVQKSEGAVSYTEEAKERFRLFYAENDQVMNEAGDKMAVYFSRKPDHVHRMAMLLQVSTGKGLVIHEEMLERAIGLLGILEHGMEVAYRQAGLEKPGQMQLRVTNALEKSGGKLDHSGMLRKVSDIMDTNQLKQVVELLVQMGDVETWMEVDKTQTTMKRWYRLTRRKG